MNIDIPRALLVIALAVAGVVLFIRAAGGGGPLYYFGSAVCLGMAYAAFQAARGASAAAGRRQRSGTRTKGGGGR